MAAALETPAARTLDVGGSPVDVHVTGAGPALLLLHGSGPGTTAWGAWRATAEALAGRMLLVAPDQAGFGGSPAPAGGPSRAAWTAQATGVMDALGIERYAVAGHSMGGAIALSAAAARPEAVRAVVGIGCLGAPMPLPPGLDRLWAARPTPEGAATVVDLVAPGDDAPPADDGAPGAPGADEGLPGAPRDDRPPEPPGAPGADERAAAVAARLEAMRAQGGDAYAALFPPPRERHLRDLTLTPDELAAVRAPVLLVHGARDRIVPLRAALPLVERLPDARLHVLGPCGHAPHAERPDTVHRLVADFLENDA